MNSIAATAGPAAKPRLGFFGWGGQSAALWEALQGGASPPADTPIFIPGGGRAATRSSQSIIPHPEPSQPVTLQPVPSVEALFSVCDSIMVELPPAQVKQVIPMIRLSIADRHMLVLLGQSWSIDAVLGQLNERKLVRCMVLPSRQGQPPLVAFCATPFVEAAELEAFRGLFAHVEHLMEAAGETQFLAMLSLAGIAPAGFYTIVDALADGAQMVGLPREQALRLTAALLSDSAQRVLEDGRHPALLREDALENSVAASGLMELESAGIRGLMMRTVERAMARVRQGASQLPNEEE